MTPTPTGARLAQPDETRAIARLLADAFFDDPLWEWMVPDPERRRVHLVPLFERLIRRPVLSGWVLTTDEPGGAAQWCAPGQWKVSPIEGMRMSGTLLRAIGPGLVRSRLGALIAMEQHHPAEPHWYLQIIGTDPTRRGSGIGTVLMDAMLERIDREFLPAYLESTKEQNLAFYHRFGFEVTEEVRPHPESPPIWSMWRPAA